MSGHPAMDRVLAEQQDRRAVIAALEAWEDACTRAHRPDGRATLLNTALLITAGDTLKDLLLSQLEKGYAMTTAEDRPVKQVIVIRRDLGMRRGKEIAQGAHASGKWLANRILWDAAGLTGHVLVTLPEAMWLQGPVTKVTCQVPDEAALLAVLDAAEQAGVMAYAIEDAGRTEFGGRITLTAVAVGPDYADLVDTVTGQLTLY